MATMSKADKKAIKATDRKLLKKKFQNNWDCYLYMLPYGLIFFLFTVLPVLASIVLSFTYYNVLEAPTFIGLDNYRTLLASDDIFITAVKNTLEIAVITGPVGYIMCVMFSWLINELGPKTRAVMVTILYAPSISGAAYTIFGIMFSGDSYGWVNGTLINLGLKGKLLERSLIRN